MKRLILPLASAALLLTLAFLCLLAWPRYQQYRQARALRHARAFMLRGDFPNASLSARQVLQAAPRNLEAWRIMADLAEACRSPAALDWQQRIAEMSPTMANRLKLASDALRFQRPPYALAAQTLRDLEPLGREVPAFHVLSAELALKLSQVAEATAHFEQAARLEPTNELHRFNLAVLNLQSTNQDTRRAAGVNLERLSTNRELSYLALRWRIAESMHRNNLEGARRLSDQIVADSRSGLLDRLQHLRILQLSQNPSFLLYLRGVQERAATNAVDIYSTSEWMGSHGLANEAIHWLLMFDPKQRERQPMPLARLSLLAGGRSRKCLQIRTSF
jgi:tetratricopeptide (TPR) repeat protein